MSDQIFNQIAGGMSELNSALTSAFLPTGSRCFLLKRSLNSGKFTIVSELVSGWFLEFSEYRGQFKLLMATSDNSFADLISQTSFIGYGVPDLDSQIEVFQIMEANRDIIPPVGTNPNWKVYCEKLPNERFTII